MPMRFIKRFFFIILLLLIAFFIYRLISPKAANALLFDLKTFSNDKIGTHFILSGEVLVTTWTLVDTWVIIDTTGVVLNDTWIFQENTGDELLLNDTENMQNTGTALVVDTWTITQSPCPALPTVSSCPTGQEKYIVYSSSTCGVYYACKTKTVSAKPSPSSHGLSTQDKNTTKTILQWFGN